MFLFLPIRQLNNQIFKERWSFISNHFIKRDQKQKLKLRKHSLIQYKNNVCIMSAVLAAMSTAVW